MDQLIFDLTIVFVCSAFLAYMAVFFKQPIIIAYIICGFIVGPWGIGLVQHVELIEDISHLGITLLLFLAGLSMQPQKLMQLFKITSMVTLFTCGASFLTSYMICYLFQFSFIDCLCISLAMMFSSTILVIKLLPTTQLHHDRMGAFCVGILILQDLIAIGVLALIRCLNSPDGILISFSLLNIKFIIFLILLLLFERYILRNIIKHLERFHESLFILGIAWCLGIASISHQLGIFYETGAFFAGVVLARHSVALFLSESLKPLRDFFLVLFFFALGSQIDLLVMKTILIPSMILAGVLIMVKPMFFKFIMVFLKEPIDFSKEVGLRLGQLSEFSLLVAALAFELNHISKSAALVIQLVCILSFIISSYVIVFMYPTPIGVTRKLKKD